VRGSDRGALLATIEAAARGREGASRPSTLVTTFAVYCSMLLLIPFMRSRQGAQGRRGGEEGEEGARDLGRPARAD